MATALSLHEEEFEGILVLTVKGSIEGRATRDLHKALLGHLAKNRLALLLDCTALDSIAGAGLRVLVTIAERLESQGGALALCSLRQNVLRVLEMAGMDRLEIFVDRPTGWNWLEATVRRQRIARLAARLLREVSTTEERYAPTMVDIDRLDKGVALLRASLVSGTNPLPTR
jgi:anti-anti-sigma factor